MSTLYPDVLAGLTDVIREICGDATADRVAPEATFDETLDIDSLTMVEVVVACEERFGVRIPDEDIERLSTVGDAVEYIAAAGVAA